MNLERPKYTGAITPGKLLIAEPFLGDPSFMRTVVLICEHGPDGTVGFVINKPTPATLDELLPETYVNDVVIFNGGPVQLDTLHMLHRLPDMLGGNKVIENIHWGGSYEALQNTITHNADIKLFVGYSGWGAGQLDQEMEQGSWLVGDATENLLFETATEDIWKVAVLALGKEYAPLVNLPVNPQLN